MIDIFQWLRECRRIELEREIIMWPCLPARFWEKVSMSLSGCWGWTGCLVKSNHLLYPKFTIKGVSFPAHRVMYLMTHGATSRELEIHHECRNTICVNPSHLRAVTGRENRLMSDGVSGVNSRKTHCKRGHALEGDNLIVYLLPRPKRVCHACQLLWQGRPVVETTEFKEVKP
jgi:hypothetical protein